MDPEELPKIRKNHSRKNSGAEAAVDAEVVKVRSLSISEPEPEIGRGGGDEDSPGPDPELNESESSCLDNEKDKNGKCSPVGAETSDSILLKRSNSRSRNSRHYRTNHRILDDSSNDSSGFQQNNNNDPSENGKPNVAELSGPSASSSVGPKYNRNYDTKRPSGDDQGSDPDSPLSKYMKRKHETDRDEEDEPEEDHRNSELEHESSNSSTDNHTTTDGDSQQEIDGSPSRFFEILSSSNSGDSDPEDNQDGHESTPPSARRLILDSSSSSESSLLFEEEPSSSSSSDVYLEDLDDRADSEQGSGEETATASNKASKTRKNKKTDSTKKMELPPVLSKPKPKGRWIGPKELMRRELGFNSRQQPQTAELFRSGFYGSLFSAERLELMIKLDSHKGCVNCLNFNFSGTKLCSGSDDLEIKIWNYGIGKCLTSFQSGHRANVFQAKFVPYIGLDTVIVSCARDNQVRLNELSTSGDVLSSKKLAQHRGPAHKLCVNPENPHVILSCGEDSFVFSIDVREEGYTRLFNVRDSGKKVSLYSIHQNPFAPFEVCVSGKDQFVRVYDTRRVQSSSSNESSSTTPTNIPLKKFCPHHLLDGQATSSIPFERTNVTAAMYNYNGKEILASYNDENIYLFDSSHSDQADYIKKYEGHRNSATVKGVNFFGDRSQFVVSGSDCGHVFVWDKEAECIVNFFRGDENGVVNCLESHPTVPILATSGLDEDVKIWIPSQEKPPKMQDLASTVRRNIRKREEEAKESPDSDGFIMWALINQMRRSSRRRRRGGDLNDSDFSPFESDDDGDDGPNGLGVECSVS